MVVIPAGVKHCLENRGRAAAVTFNVYSPPEYLLTRKADQAAIIGLESCDEAVPSNFV